MSQHYSTFDFSVARSYKRVISVLKKKKMYTVFKLVVAAIALYVHPFLLFGVVAFFLFFRGTAQKLRRCMTSQKTLDAEYAASYKGPVAVNVMTGMTMAFNEEGSGVDSEGNVGYGTFI